MAKKNVRIYFSTFIDLEVDGAELATDKEIIDSVEENVSVYLDGREGEVMDNIRIQEGMSDISNID